MNVYVESNFVLQLALLQEFHASCEAIVNLCEAGCARLVIPAFSLIEPYRSSTLMPRISTIRTSSRSWQITIAS